jgi:hypothetical protein
VGSAADGDSRRVLADGGLLDLDRIALDLDRIAAQSREYRLVARPPPHAANLRSPATHVSLTLMSAIASGLTL